MLGDPSLDRLTRLMDVAVLKAQVHAANLANQNTPGYRAKAVSFDAAYQAALEQGDEAGAARLEPTIVEPRDTTVSIDGNDVDPDREILASADNTMKYNALIAIMRGKAHLLNTAISPAP
jgi:flagellar basal-body rod protein FlgB